MDYIGNYSQTEQILRKYDFKIRKKYGQNFLIDPNILTKIVEAAQVGPGDAVLEIGPGLGTLTQYLASRAKCVTAVEIDTNLIPILRETLAAYPNAEVIHEDILRYDIDGYFRRLREQDADICLKVVANLPYYITTPVIMKLLEGETPFDTMLFMVQKEVAQRLCASPGSKDYGALTLAASYYTELRIAGTVPPTCFIPRPNVESALLLMRRWKEKPVTVLEEKLLFRLIRASFNQRRKTLLNGITGYEGLPFTKEEIAEALSRAQLPLQVRGEALTLGQFAALSDILTPLYRQKGE